MQRENKVRFGITMSPGLLKKIDEDRGLIPRSTFIEHRIRRYYQLKEDILNICEGTLQVITERTPPHVPIPASKTRIVFSAHTMKLIGYIKEKILEIKNLLVEEK